MRKETSKTRVTRGVWKQPVPHIWPTKHSVLRTVPKLCLLGIKGVLCSLFGLLVFPLSFSAEHKASQNQQNKIRTQPSVVSLDEKIRQEITSSPPIIETFNSALFKTDIKKRKKPSASLKWFFAKDVQEKRQTIKGSRRSAFESYWKINLDGFWQKDYSVDKTQVMRTKFNVKVLTQLAKVFFAKAEFELLTSTGSVQQIYERLGESNGISQREVLFLWKATNWLTVEFGAINQGFLQAPLLLASIPFPSVVNNIELYKEGKQDLSFSIQLAWPSTFSADNSIGLQSLEKHPLLFTKSLFWNYDSKTFYNVRIAGHFFYYTPLTSDIATASKLYGNTVIGEPSRFKYNYTGFYLGIEPSFQLVPRLGLNLKAHYIVNVSDMQKEQNLNQGLLYSLQVPFDITENIRVTPVLEYFINQPDSSVGYYNSERYGHSDRTGFVGELVFNFYDRNISTGFRYHNSRAVREGGSLKEGQNYYLVFLRTGYAKI